jgi:hypothetical protein
LLFEESSYVGGNTLTGHVFKNSATKDQYFFCSGAETGRTAACSGSPVASAIMKYGLKSTGWDELNLKTFGAFTDQEQAYAAGFLEGALSADHIDKFAEAWVRHKYKPEQRKNFMKFIQSNEDFMNKNIKLYGQVDGTDENSKYWFQMNLVMQQMKGVLDGYNQHTTGAKMTNLDMWLINDDGDILDIERLVSPGIRFKEVKDMSSEEVRIVLDRKIECFEPDFDEVLTDVLVVSLLENPCKMHLFNAAICSITQVAVLNWLLFFLLCP